MPHPNKAIIRRLVTEVLNHGRWDVLDELATPDWARAAKLWIIPFREAFPDLHLEIADLIAEGDKVMARLSGSGTHHGPWHGHPPTGRCFRQVAEIYIFTVRDGIIVHAWGLQDTPARMTQLGLIGPASCR